MKKKKILTIKQISKLFKRAEIIYQDQQNQNIFYLIDRLYVDGEKWKKWSKDLSYPIYENEFDKSKKKV